MLYIKVHTASFISAANYTAKTFNII